MTETDASTTAHTAHTDVAVACAPGAGRGTWAMGSIFEHLVGAEQTGGSLGVALVSQPPGVATPVHRHHHEAEAFYLLDGQMTYVAGDETFELDAGWFMYLPRGLPHAFRIRGDRPARFLALTVPGGLLRLYDEVGVPATALRIPTENEGRPMAEEVARWADVGPHYGLEVLGPPIPE